MTSNTRAYQSSATSPEASLVSHAMLQLQKQHEASQSLFGRKSNAITHLHEAIARATLEADAEAGELIPNSMAVKNAEEFLRALPNDKRIPEFGLDPDGAISLDWIVAPSKIFSISISDRPEIAYAWLDGSDRGHGVSGFREQGIPKQMLDLISTITADEHPFLWAA